MSRNFSELKSGGGDNSYAVPPTLKIAPPIDARGVSVYHINICTT